MTFARLPGLLVPLGLCLLVLQVLAPAQVLEEPLGLALVLFGLEVQVEEVPAPVQVQEGLATEELLGLEVRRG